MKKIHYIIIVCVLSIASSFAQSSLRDIRIIRESRTNKPLTQQNLSTINAKGVKGGNMVVSEDTIYCIVTKKQHGWFSPMDTISKDVIDKVNHIRFTKKNAAGHWLRMETIDTHGNYRKGVFAPYILKLGSAESDSKAKKEWIEKLNTACIYEFVADYKGETIVQERAYDENMNIIYTFSRVAIGNNQYNCSYKDSYGLPAEMRSDEGCTYGTLVRITEDMWGNDSIIQYIDAKGKPKLNSDSVAMEVYICDKEGHVKKQQSRNLDGTLAIDNWGNCGIEYHWYENRISKATYMDDNWRPMRMPALRGAEGREGVMTVNYLYDEFGRQTVEFYTDSLGKLDTNILGTHKIVYEYNDNGDLLKMSGYDLFSNLSPIYNSGTAVQLFTYDKQGRIVEGIFLDKHHNPNPTAGYLSKIVHRYNKQGNEILTEQYFIESGEEKLYYKKEECPYVIYTQWNDGSYRVDSLDYNKRTTYVGFYDAQGNLKMNGERAYETYTYLDEDKKCTSIEIDYDLLSNKTDVNGICKTINVFDSINWTQSKWRYDKNDNLKETFIFQFDSGFNKLLSEYDANKYGVISRSGGTASVRHYVGGIVYSQKGEFASLVGRDEFDEPDYITSNYTTYYYNKSFPNSKSKYYDEENNEVKDEEELRDRLPKVMTIEIIDSAAYKLGLRDNDVIILYGDYAVDINALDSICPSYYQFRRDWSVRSILDAKKEKRMVVYRIDNPQKGEFGLIEIKGLVGTPSEIGFIPHIRYLTKKQLHRIQNSVNNSINAEMPLLLKSDLRKSEESGENHIVIAYTEMYRSVRDKLYATQITDPAILLGACTKDRQMYWNMIKGEDTEEFEHMLDYRKKYALQYPTMNFYLTKDMQNINTLVLTEMGVYTNWFTTYISDKDFMQLMALNKYVINSMDSIKAIPSTIPSKQLEGRWDVVKKSEQIGAPEGHILLEKDGQCKGVLTNYGIINYSEGTAVYKIDKIYDGVWSHHDSLIVFKPYNKDSIGLSCIGLIGNDDEDLITRAVAYLNKVCQENKESVLSKMEYVSIRWEDDLFIDSIDKKFLKIKDSDNNVITFEKIKKNKDNHNKSQNVSKRKSSPYPKIQSARNPMLIGNWDMEISDMEGAKVILALGDDGKTSLFIKGSFRENLQENIVISFIISMTTHGTWSDNGDAIDIVNNPSLTNISIDFDFEGVDEVVKEILRKEMTSQLEPQKEEFVLQVLKNKLLEGKISIEKLTEKELILKGKTFHKILTQD